MFQTMTLSMFSSSASLISAL